MIQIRVPKKIPTSKKKKKKKKREETMTTIYPKICSKLNLEKIQAYKKCLDKTPYQSLRRTTIKNIYI